MALAQYLFFSGPPFWHTKHRRIRSRRVRIRIRRRREKRRKKREVKIVTNEINVIKKTCTNK